VVTLTESNLHAPLEPMQTALRVGLDLVYLALGEDVDLE
jgi:hypothetical protein